MMDMVHICSHRPLGLVMTDTMGSACIQTYLGFLIPSPRNQSEKKVPKKSGAQTNAQTQLHQFDFFLMKRGAKKIDWDVGRQ